MNLSPLGSWGDLPAYLDTEDWPIPAVFSDPETGTPLDLTGSLLRVTFVSLFGDEVGTATNVPGADGGSIELTNPIAGEALITLPVDQRGGWIVPAANMRAFGVVVLEGDVLRRPGSDFTDPREWVGTIRIRVKRGSTEWPF